MEKIKIDHSTEREKFLPLNREDMEARGWDADTSRPKSETLARLGLDT